MNSFNIAPTPQLVFGAGKIDTLTSFIKLFGSKVLLVTGARSFKSSRHANQIPDKLTNANITLARCSIDREPSPAMIDDIVSQVRQYNPDVVVAIGGGSVVDGGKAIAAMLPVQKPVKDFLEGVGTSAHSGIKVPFIAVPTTSGTGSEATKNAVLSETGEQGFKRSLRHNNFVPNVAIIDPLLTITCPPSVTAASGMDAFTQLLESYLSTQANPITDALALEGLRKISDSLLRAYEDGENIDARTDMALAAYLSGVTLANAGLGLVHGFASSVGGFFDISHGVVCSSLMSACNKLTVEKLRSSNTGNEALAKYAAAGGIFAKSSGKSDNYYIDFLIDVIEQYAHALKIPKLGSYGINSTRFEKVVNATDNKYNPIALDKDEMTTILKMSV